MTEPTERDREMAKAFVGNPLPESVDPFEKAIFDSSVNRLAPIIAQAREEGEKDGRTDMDGWRQGMMHVLDALAEAAIPMDHSPDNRIRALTQQRAALIAQVREWAERNASTDLHWDCSSHFGADGDRHKTVEVPDLLAFLDTIGGKP